MSATKKNSKTDKYFKVAQVILEIIGSEGIKSVSHSKISRKSKISRAWIYQYVGSKKEELVEVAVNIVGEYFARTNKNTPITTRNELAESLEEAANFVFNSIKTEPTVVLLYYRFRGSPTSMGKAIERYEKKWSKYSAENFIRILNMDKDQANNFSNLILTLRLGLAHQVITSKTPAKTIEESKKILSFIHKQILSFDAS